MPRIPSSLYHSDLVATGIHWVKYEDPNVTHYGWGVDPQTWPESQTKHRDLHFLYSPKTPT